MTIAVAGRTRRSYVSQRFFNHSVRVCGDSVRTNPHRMVRITPENCKCRGPRMVAGASAT